MTTRIVAALVALPLFIIPIYLGGLWCTLLFVIVVLAASYEFYNLLVAGGYQPNRWIGMAWLIPLVLSGWRPVLFPLSAVLVVGLLVSIAGTLPRRDDPTGAWMSTVVVAVYLGVTASQTLALRQLADGLWWLVFGLIVTWVSDAAAYFTGVTVGHNKLWPRISPKKTWEGTIGGWVAASLAAVAVVWLSPLAEPLWLVAIFGATCGVLALLGDLSISMVKRHVGVKDSGHFLPGHGGLLDRLDSLLFVLPFVATIVLYRAG